MKSLGTGQGLRRLNSDFVTKFISESGTKPRNRDYFAFVEMDGFACWAISETYDNDPDMISAKLAVEAVISMFSKKPSISAGKLKSYVIEAHRQLKEQSGNFQLKASIMVVATNYKKMRYAHVGNCRLHIFRGSTIFHRSEDQSLYQHMVKQGEILPDDEIQGVAEQRNLLSYLGKEGSIKVDVSKKMVLEDEDILLLSTWGFWEKVNTLEMLDALENYESPQDYIDQLHDLYLSKQEGEVNNHTLAGIFANKTFQEKDNKKKIIKIALMIGIPLLIIGIVFAILFSINNANRNQLITTIAEFEHRGDILIQDGNFLRALSEYDSALDESRELGGRRARLVNENNQIREALTTRQRITQLIVDGDTLYREGNFNEARQSFERALDEARLNPEFYDLLDTLIIINRIGLAIDSKLIGELILLGDFQEGLGLLDQALLNLDEARRIAESNRNIQVANDIRLRMERIRSQLLADASAIQAAQREQEELAERERQELDAQAHASRMQIAELSELQGDMAVGDGDFERALRIYGQVQQAFLGMGEIGRAAEIQLKIQNVNNIIQQETDNGQLQIAAGHMQAGDLLMLENNYEDALENYRRARDIYTLLGRTSYVVLANDKINTAIVRQAEAERANSILTEIQRLEAEGVMMVSTGDYRGAIERFSQAQILYRGMNQMYRVLILQDKINAIEELLRREQEEPDI